MNPLRSVAAVLLALVIPVTSARAASTPPAVVDAVFPTATTVSVTAASYAATGNTVNLALGFAPPTGTSLTVVKNTGLGFIQGTFDNLAQGQKVMLGFNGLNYPFVANYFGGTGNDLVLQWAYTRIYAWGDNTFNGYGIGNNSTSTVPLAVNHGGFLAGKTLVSLALGGDTTLALYADGTLAAWGSGNYGELGNGGTSSRNLPVDITSSGVLAGRRVVAIAAGTDHSLALCSDGSVAAWGRNQRGQVGDGTTTNATRPVAVDPSGVLAGKTVVAISAGTDQSLALCSDGTAVCWGYNNYGQLGNGTTTNSSVPVAVTASGVLAGKQVIAISGGGSHNTALCADSTIVSWGYGIYGALGNGGSANSSVPVAVTRTGVLAGKTVTAITNSQLYCLAMCSDRTLVSWGYNNGGLGNGVTGDAKVPVSVVSTGVLSGKTPVMIAASYPSYALCSDGTMAAWGDNQRYQYGNGTSNSANVPTATSLATLGTGEKFINLGVGCYAAHTLAIAAVPLASNSKLATLAVSGAVMEPVFDPAVTGYTARVMHGTPTVTVTPVVADGMAVVTVNGEVVAPGADSPAIPATSGSKLTVKTTAENGGATTYLLTVAEDATLASLGLSAGALVPDFSPVVKTYSVAVSAATESLVLTPVAADATAAVTVNGTPIATGAASGPIPVAVGNNTVTVGVTALDGTATSYQLTVARAAPVNFTYLAATGTPVTQSAYVADGNTVALTLGYAPVTGTALTVINNTGNDRIVGRFSNLAQGQVVELVYNQARYRFVANYHGGTGNDLVLQWAPNKPYGWGGNGSGQVGAGGGNNINSPTAVYTSGVLAGKTLTAMATGSDYSLALCSDGTLAAWGMNNAGQLGDGSTIDSGGAVAVKTSGVLAGKTVVAIAAGSYHSLALCADGTLAAWGSNDSGKLGNGILYPSSVPVLVNTAGALAGKTVVAIAAGGDHSLALCSDGTLVAWGANVTGQLGTGTTTACIVPTVITGNGALAGKTVTAISAGTDHSLARCSDGTLAAWGYNSAYQLGDGTTTTRTLPTAIPKTGVFAGKSVSQISAGGEHNLALCSDGVLIAWGSNNASQLGNGASTTVPVLVSTSGALAGKTVSAISAGRTFSLAACTDGTLAQWGYNLTGWMGTPYYSTPVAVAATAFGTGEKVTALARGATAEHALILTSLPVSTNSKLAALTVNGGVLDPAFVSATTAYTARVPHGTTSVTLTPTTGDGSASLTVNGVPLASGATSAEIPIAPGNQTITVRVTAQNGVGVTTYVITVKDDSTLASLALSAGSLVPAFAPATTAYTTYVPTATAAVTVTPTATEASAAITVNGAAVNSGNASDPVALNPGSNVITVRATALDGTVTSYVLTVIRQVPINYTFNVAGGTAASGATYTAAGNTMNLTLGFAPPVGTNLRVVNNTGMAPIQGVFDNLAHGQRVILTYNGVNYPFVANYYSGTGNDLMLQWANVRLLAWGANSNGQLGNGGTSSSSVGVPVNMTGALAGKTLLTAVAGGFHNFALPADGALAAWGYNNPGQLGDDGWNDSLVPVPVSGAQTGPTIMTVAGGTYHSLALRADGTILGWGSNDRGQLGDGSTFSSRVPGPVDQTGVLAGKVVTAIAAGGSFSLALCADGTLAAWGSNYNGQLGNNSDLDSSVPVLVLRAGVLLGQTVTAIAAGESHCLALCSDGTLVGWGDNTYRQVGNNNLTDSKVPVLVDRSGVLSGKTVTAIAAGSKHSLALCSDSVVAGWGDGGQGQLGTGSYQYQQGPPVLVSRTGVLSGKAIVGIAAGMDFSLAVNSDGTMATWGWNINGQLGNNTTTTSLLPVLVNTGGLASGERFVAAKAGSSHCLALVASPLLPSATTLAATDILDTATTLKGNVSGNGTSSTVTFQYGLTAAYGSTVTASPATVSGTVTTAVGAALSNLIPNTTYHYRLVATSTGGTVYGADLTFATTNFAALASLTLSAGDLSPAFASQVTAYGTTLPYSADAITVTPVSAAPDATVTVNGVTVASGAASAPLPLAVGNTLVTVAVISGNGSNARTYRLTVTRLPERFTFNTAAEVPVTSGGFLAAGEAPEISLNFAPLAGTTLTVVNNTGPNPIQGTFANLAQGQAVNLTYNGVAYAYVANYFGGTGNDLVLHWANLRLMAWGGNYNPNYGQLGNGSNTNSSQPVAVNLTGVLAGRTIIAAATGDYHNLVLCADGTLATWGRNDQGELGIGYSNSSNVPVRVNQTGALAGRQVVAIAAGADHSMVLDKDGGLFVWGNNWGGQLGDGTTNDSSLPQRIDGNGALAGRRITAIWAGNNCSFALCADGKLAAWGWNEQGQLGDGTVTTRYLPVLLNQSGVLAGKTIRELATGSNHTLCWCTDGTLASWGLNGSGQLGNGGTTNSSSPVLVTRTGVLSGKTVAALTSGGNHGLVLCTDGTVAAWGSNDFGQMGDGTTTQRTTPVLVTRTGVLAGKTVTGLCGGENFSAVHCADGTTAAWGYNYYGQLGNGNTTDQTLPVLVGPGFPAPRELVVRLDGGAGHQLALLALPPPPRPATLAATAITDTGATLGGSVNASLNTSTVSFEYGLTDSYGNTVAATPTTVTGTTDTAVSATIGGLRPGTTYHFRAVASSVDGAVKGADMTFATTTLATLADLRLSVGTLSPGFDSNTTSYFATVPSATSSLTVTPVVTTPDAVVTINGDAVESGVASGPLDLTVGNTPITIAVASADGANEMSYAVMVTRLPAVCTFDAATDVPMTVENLVANGNPVDFALNFAPVAGTRLTVVNNTGRNPIEGVFSNLAQGHTVTFTRDGVTYSFVANYFGGTGNDLVLEWANTRVMGWGNNSKGQLGNNNTATSFAAVQADRSGVLAGKTVIAAGTGSSHSIALCSDGTLAAWGYNSYGQLGNGAYTDSSVPVLVSRTGALAGKTVVAVAAGGSHNLALCADGAVVAWGYNNYGQLGNGGTDISNVPVLVDRGGVLAGKTVIALAAGENHSLALCADGTLAAWGYHSYGQLGIGTTTSDRYAIPMRVTQTGVLLGKTITGIVAGTTHSLACCADGSVAAWGRNNYGQLGDNSTTNRYAPVLANQTGALAGKSVIALAAGASHCVALCADGSLAAWGYNTYGQLGDASTTNRSVPVAVTQSGALAGKVVRSLTAGSSHNLALCADGTVAAWGYNNSGQLGDGTTTNRNAPVLATALGLGEGERVLTTAGGFSFSLVRVASPPPPLATSLAASDIRDTGATLNGRVNAQGSGAAMSFEYGPTSAYGHTLAATPATITGTADSAVSATLGGLLPGRVYHFRVIAPHAGGAVTGEDLTFTTTTHASLADLTTSAGAILPVFDAAISSYALTVPASVTSITVTPTAANPAASISVNGTAVASGTASGPLALAEGTNPVGIEVVSAGDGNTRSYTLAVVRLPAEFALASATEAPLTVGGFAAMGDAPPITLAFAPAVGTTLTLVRNSGLASISGTFANLTQGQPVRLEFGGVTYPFVANYYGGSGNDLVLQWASTRLLSWGRGGDGQLGNGGTAYRTIPGPVVMTGVFAGKTLTMIAAGSSHGLGLCSDGTLGAWGTNSPGSTPGAIHGTGALAGKTVVAIAAGGYHSLGLGADGALTAWGNNSYGQLGDGSQAYSYAPVAVVQNGALVGRRVVAIAAGSSHNLALCADGTLVAWGDNTAGQLGDGTGVASNVPVAVNQTGVLAGKTIVAIACGNAHSLALTADGMIAAWGNNGTGALGTGNTNNSNVPVQVDQTGVLAGKTVTAIAGGRGCSMALCADGLIASWGDNSYGQLGVSGVTGNLPVWVDQTGVLAGRTVTAIDAGSEYSVLALCQDGRLSLWGKNEYGQLGNNTTTASSVPVLTDISAMAAGERFIAAASGGLFHFGLVASPPPPVATTLAATSMTDSAVTLNGSVNGQGNSATVAFEYGLTTNYGSVAAASPATVSGSTTTPVSAGISGLLSGTTYHFRAVAGSPFGNIKGDDLTFTTGIQADLANLTLSEGTLNPAFASFTTDYVATVPFSVGSLTVTPVAAVAGATVKVNQVAATVGAPSEPISLNAGENAICVEVVSADGINAKTYLISVVRMPEVFRFDVATTVPLTVSGFAASGQTATLVLNHAPLPGSNLMMVNNTGINPIHGQFANLAQGQIVRFEYGGLVYPFVVDYFGGTGNDLVLRWANSRLMAWGSAASNALGNGSGSNSYTPVPVVMAGVLDRRTVAETVSNGSHTLVRCADGALVTWGDNAYGQLGNGGSAASGPVLVDRTGVLAGRTVVAIATGGGHDLAVCADGTLASWGYNNYGQLGNNSTASSSVPVLVDTSGVLAGKQVLAAGCGGNHSVVLCADGTLAAWGYNSGGRLGNGGTTGSNVPVLVDRSGVLAGKAVRMLAVGGGHNLVLCADGSLAAWGENSYGQLGNGTTTSSSVPVLVNQTGLLTGKTVIAISAGGSHSLALCADGTVAAWGYNNYGQLGNLSGTNSSVPVAVNQAGTLAGKTVVGISAGGNHSLAMTADGAIAAWGYNNSGQLGNGTTYNSSVPAPITGAADRWVGLAAGYSHSVGLLAAPPTPIVETLAAADISDTGATLQGRVNGNGSEASVSFEYGLTPAYGSVAAAIPALVSGTTATATQAMIGGLDPGLTYHYRVVATRPDGVTRGEDLTFTTSTLTALDSLSLSHGTLSPAFSMIVRDYIATVPEAISAVRVTPVAASADATIRIGGVVVASAAASEPIPLAPGDNRVEIVVTAAAGAPSRTYAVTVTRLPAKFTFDGPVDVPVTVRDFVATGVAVEFALNHVPAAGARLTALRNTGNLPIQGRFSNLAQGQLVYLSHNGITYTYVADYFGGTGNDLVLHWANTRLLAFGENQYGKLGDGSTTSRSAPVPVTDTGVLHGKTVIDIKCGANHSVALCSDGTVATWGNNNEGQLGRTGAASSVPVAVDQTGVLAGKRVVGIASGGYHVFAWCEDGTLVGWGGNGSGNLGDIGVTSTSVPMLIPMTGPIAGRRITSMAAGQVHTLALCTDGTLAGWGYTGDGQVGTGGSGWILKPTLVDRAGILAGKTVVAISAGQFFSLARCSDGTLAAWGNDGSGQLGNGGAGYSSVPVGVDQTGVLAGKSVVAIECGAANSVAWCADGTIAMWGGGSSGSLGNGGTTLSQVPVAVDQTGILAGKTVVGVSSGGGHNLAWSDDGSLASWGYNSAGQLGDGSLTNRTVPVTVVTTSLRVGERFVAATCGDWHGVAIVASPPLPLATTLAATEVATTTAVLNGSVNANGSDTAVSFEYGLTTNYGATAAAVPAALTGSDAASGRASLSGLVENTTYHFRVVATSAGGTVTGDDVTFATPVNLPPVFADYAVGTPFQTATTVAFRKLLAKATDPNGDALTVTAVGPTSAPGGTATLQATGIRYTPPTGFTGADSFPVTITDAGGAVVTGTVTVTVGPAPTGGGLTANQPVLNRLPDGKISLKFQGIPGRTYQIQRSADLTTWATLATVTATASGALTFTDESPPEPSAYYRLALP